MHTHLLVSILEDHTIDTPADVVNTLCIIDTNSKTINPLISGADFYAAPKFSPGGTRIAWQQWFHPDMPWEGGELHVADVIFHSGSLSVKNDVHIGGERQKVSCAFPTWATNDTLIYTSDESGYINPWKYTRGKSTPLFPKPVAFEFGVPSWVLHLLPYAIIDKEAKHALFSTVKDGRNGLYLVDLAGGSEPTPIESPYVGIGSPRTVSRESGEVVFTAEKVDEEPSIINCTIGDISQPPKYTVLKSSPPKPFPRELVSIPQPMSLKAPSGDLIHIVYYAPKNPQYSGSSIEGELPPCTLYVHGGPTGLTKQGLNWTIQYFTSRGWAW